MLKSRLLTAAAGQVANGGGTPTPLVGTGYPLSGIPSTLLALDQNLRYIGSAGSNTAGCAFVYSNKSGVDGMQVTLVAPSASGTNIEIKATATSTVNPVWSNIVVTDDLNPNTVIYTSPSGTGGARYIGTITRTGTTGFTISSTGNLTLTPTNATAYTNSDVCTINSSNALFWGNPTLSGTATGTPSVYLLGIDNSNNITQKAIATNPPVILGDGVAPVMAALSSTLVVYAWTDGAARGASSGHVYFSAMDVNTTANTVNMNGATFTQGTYDATTKVVGAPIIIPVSSTQAIISYYESPQSASQLNYQTFVLVTVGTGGAITVNQTIRQFSGRPPFSQYNKRGKLDLTGKVWFNTGLTSYWRYTDSTAFTYSIGASGNSLVISPYYPWSSDNITNGYLPVCYDGYNYISSYFSRTFIQNGNNDAFAGLYKPLGGATWGATFTGNKFTNNVSGGANAPSNNAANIAGFWCCDQGTYGTSYVATNLALQISAGITPRDNNLFGNGSAQAGLGLVAGPVNIGGYGAQGIISAPTSTGILLSYVNYYGNFASNTTPGFATLTSLNANTAIFEIPGNWITVFYNTTAGIRADFYRQSSDNVNSVLSGQTVYNYSGAVAAGTTISAVKLQRTSWVVASNWYNSGGVGTAQLTYFLSSAAFSSTSIAASVPAPFVCASGTKPQLTLLDYNTTDGYIMMYAGIDALGAIKAAPVYLKGTTITNGTTSTLFTGLAANTIANTPKLVNVSPTEAMLAYGANFVLLTHNRTTGAITAGTSYPLGATNTNNTTLINPNQVVDDMQFRGTDRVIAFAANSAASQISITQINRV